jgi:hypothetical protein
MADQQAPVPEGQDTPAAAGPEGTGAAEQAEVDWQKRYSDLQPEYTRTSQEAAELRNWRQWAELAFTSEDADTRRQALEALGYQVEEPEEEPVDQAAEYEDPYEHLLTRQEQVEQRLAEREQAEQEARENALIKAYTDERLAQLDGLSEEDQDWVLAYAINAMPAVREPGVPVPLPDVKGAFEVFQSRETERQKQWAQTKRAPYVPPGGQTATEVPDLESHQGRVDYAVRQLQQAEAQE